MEQYANVQQLMKKEDGQNRKPIYPPTVIQAVFDAKTGASLEAILAQFNSIYVQYQGTSEDTRNIIPEVMRRPGLTITYMNMDSETITERASSAVQKDNDHWGLDTNWSRVDELSLSGDIAVSANGTWIINGEDTGVKAVGPKGDTGLTPWLKTIDNKLHYSYDNENWEECSEDIAAYFRFLATSSDSQAESVGKIQISRDGSTWTDLSPEFTNNLRIAGYVATSSELPTGKPVGTIYGVGPTYAEEDTEQTNPIYRIHVYDGTKWVDNGTFTSIAAGVVQETGDSETEVMSQKAVTEKLSELGSYVGVFNVNEYIKNNGSPFGSTAEARTAIPEKLRRYGLIIHYRLEGGWVTEQFIGTYLDPEGTAWLDEQGSRWIRFNDNKTSIGNYVLFDTNSSTTRLNIPYSERRENKIICYHNGHEFIIERYSFTDLSDGPWQLDKYWKRMGKFSYENIFNASQYNFENNGNYTLSLEDAIQLASSVGYSNYASSVFYVDETKGATIAMFNGTSLESWNNLDCWFSISAYDYFNIGYYEQIHNEAIERVLLQSYKRTDNVFNALKKHDLMPIVASTSYMRNDNYRTIVVAKNVPIGKTIAVGLIYGDKTSEALAELNLSQARIGLSEGKPVVGGSVNKIVYLGVPGLRERLENTYSDTNYITIGFQSTRTGQLADEDAINAMKYLVVKIQDEYNSITEYTPPYEYKGVLQDDFRKLEDTVKNIESIGGLIDVANAVKVIPSIKLPIGENLLGDSYQYDTNYWEVSNGVISYKGNGGQSNTFEFSGQTVNGGRYIARITALTSNGAYENLFYTQLGSTDLVDTYNGSPETIGGYKSDGGRFKLVPYGTAPFSITSVSLCPVVSEESASESITIDVENVNAGNSIGSNITGKWNVAIGPIDNTMANNVNGSRSIAIGRCAMTKWNGGLQNIAIGTFAAHLIEYGDRNIAIGADSLWQVKRAFDNVVIGNGALGKTGEYSEVNRNVAIGYHAMINNSEKTQDSIAIGYLSGRNASTRNTFVGNYSGVPISGTDNVAIGYSSMNTGYTDGNNNTCIGAGSGIDGKGTASSPQTINNSIAIGNGVKTTKSNQVRIGNSDIEEVIIGNKKIIFNSDGTCIWETI